MTSLWAFLLGAAGPLALRVIATLGLGVVTFAGVDTALASMITQAQTSWSGLTPAVLGLAGVAGMPACLGLIAGAMTARVTTWVAASAVKWITKA